MNRIDAEYHCSILFEQVWTEAMILVPGLEDKVLWKHYVKPTLRYVIQKSRVAGRAYYHDNVIEMNLSYACTGSPEDMRETIAHELSHLGCFALFSRVKQAHGPEFRSIMQCLGYAGNTYHKYDVHMAKKAVKGLRDDDVLFDL